MSEPTAEQVEAERERAEALWYAMPVGAVTAVDFLATALARVRIELSCIWDPVTTDRLTEVCKTCRWPRDRGPFIHVDNDDPDADAIRALRGRT